MAAFPCEDGDAGLRPAARHVSQANKQAAIRGQVPLPKRHWQRRAGGSGAVEVQLGFLEMALGSRLVDPLRCVAQGQRTMPIHDTHLKFHSRRL